MLHIHAWDIIQQNWASAYFCNFQEEKNSDNACVEMYEEYTVQFSVQFNTGIIL